MIIPILQKYVKAFIKLRRGSGTAPHKPILLLSIIELIDKGKITDNRVFIDMELLDIFKENWQLLVTTANIEDISLPLYYLKNDKAADHTFWYLMSNNSSSIDVHTSINTLQKVCAFGYFSSDLWFLLNDKINRETLLNILLETYFPDQIVFYRASKNVGNNYVKEETASILNDPIVKFGHRTAYSQEEIVVRNGLFQRWITGFYDYQCSFTGMKLSSTFNHNFIDACHIVPFSYSQNDSVTNGIALCPNMHRAFDRGLLSIDEDYRILVSDHLTEDTTHPYGLTQLKGKQIILPQQLNHYPSLNAIKWHRESVFKT